ncbi:ABC-ATPase domain-containing protein [Vibrio palustris]|uniref:Putative ATPase of the ABC class n=1 Tax=Vibrio palustris TaxID=1918946 RepID=A0A1R4B6T5_9VIBR|nr:ABC-ATPase domain-containing protein [Vibrio palustris]SJL84637.1 putative ATPase of the ABC class [Vibrio palustris]
MDQLTSRLKKLEKQNYRAYQQIKGEYDFGDFTLLIDYTQPDPYAPASRMRAIRPWSPSGLQWLREQSAEYQLAARDFIARSFARFAMQENAVEISMTGQTVLDNTAVLFTDEGIELRFRMNLPADGRSILAKRALNLITFHLPKFIRRATMSRELDMEALTHHCEVIEDQAALRKQLAEHNLLAFVADGSVLPRASGNSDLPMQDAVTLTAPDSLAIELTTPHRGTIRGMGIKRGITLIVGGGFHGKSTLLTAIERAVYFHIPGDGREYIVTDPQAMKIRAEDGRCVHHLNLSNYINHLPMGRDTADFSTQDASGSTSQAAWVQESIESGATSLLIDEDTSATNFMIRDQRMQALVAKDDEPITPLVDRVAQLRDELAISSLIVMGGSGDYFDVADTVIQMHDYQPIDVTAQAKDIVAQYPNARDSEPHTALQTFSPRSFHCGGLQSILSDGKFRVNATDKHTLRFGKEKVDVSALEQLESANELHCIGWLWTQLSQQPNWSNDPVGTIAKLLQNDQWYNTTPPHGDLAKPRLLDVMAVLNRMRQSQFKAQ